MIMTKWVLTAAGVVLLAIGLLWTFQGAGMVGGSVMTGQKQWLIIGLVLAVAGVGLLVGGLTRAMARHR